MHRLFSSESICESKPIKCLCLDRRFTCKLLPVDNVSGSHFIFYSCKLSKSWSSLLPLTVDLPECNFLWSCVLYSVCMSQPPQLLLMDLGDNVSQRYRLGLEFWGIQQGTIASSLRSRFFVGFSGSLLVIGRLTWNG